MSNIGIDVLSGRYYKYTYMFKTEHFRFQYTDQFKADVVQRFLADKESLVQIALNTDQISRKTIERWVTEQIFGTISCSKKAKQHSTVTAINSTYNIKNVIINVELFLRKHNGSGLMRGSVYYGLLNV